MAPTEPPGVNKVVVDVARDIYGQPVPPDLKRFLHPTANQATSAAINERRSSESPRLSVVSSEIERPRVASYGAFLSRTFTLRKIRFEDPDTERAFLRHMYHSLRLLAWGMLLVLIFNWVRSSIMHTRTLHSDAYAIPDIMDCLRPLEER